MSFPQYYTSSGNRRPFLHQQCKGNEDALLAFCEIQQNTAKHYINTDTVSIDLW